MTRRAPRMRHTGKHRWGAWKPMGRKWQLSLCGKSPCDLRAGGEGVRYRRRPTPSRGKRTW